MPKRKSNIVNRITESAGGADRPFACTLPEAAPQTDNSHPHWEMCSVRDEEWMTTQSHCSSGTQIRNVICVDECNSVGILKCTLRQRSVTNAEANFI